MLKFDETFITVMRVDVHSVAVLAQGASEEGCRCEVLKVRGVVHRSHAAVPLEALVAVKPRACCEDMRRKFA